MLAFAGRGDIVAPESVRGFLNMRSGLAAVVMAAIGLLATVSGAAAQDMLTVGQMVQICKTNGDQCAQTFNSTQISMAFLWGGNCIPANMVRQQTELAVLRWLIKHPELNNEDAPDGVADAVTSLWPCANQ
jgi:Ssp1 endopeptidase immunity protein Rap1a